LTSPDRFQLDVARLALAAAHGHGFVLAGGRALIAHGVVSRPTEDIDLFTDQADGVHEATALVVDALRSAGLRVREIAGSADLGELFDGFDQDLIEFEVTGGDQTVRLQLVRFARDHQPVEMSVGPVLHLDDIVATKVVALATRAEPRDLIDVAAMLGRYPRARLLDLARHAEPSLTDEEFADAMRRLDRLDDTVFRDLYELTDDQIAHVRERFAGWPRR
jgi:predicted nucleotidyltransferase component of viral defense system